MALQGHWHSWHEPAFPARALCNLLTTKQTSGARNVCHILCSVILLCENKTQLSSTGGAEGGFLEFYDKKSQGLKEHTTDSLTDIF